MVQFKPYKCGVGSHVVWTCVIGFIWTVVIYGINSFKIFTTSITTMASFEGFSISCTNHAHANVITILLINHAWSVYLRLIDSGGVGFHLLVMLVVVLCHACRFCVTCE